MSWRVAVSDDVHPPSDHPIDHPKHWEFLLDKSQFVSGQSPFPLVKPQFLIKSTLPVKSAAEFSQLFWKKSTIYHQVSWWNPDFSQQNPSFFMVQILSSSGKILQLGHRTGGLGQPAPRRTSMRTVTRSLGIEMGFIGVHFSWFFMG